MKRTIRNLRSFQGLTQAELSDLSGIPIVNIRFIESGRLIPMLHEKEQISQILGVKPHHILWTECFRDDEFEIDNDGFRKNDYDEE